MADRHRDSDETEEQRLNRRLDQLLQELRVAMNGAILLVTDALFDGAVVFVTVVVSAAVFIGLWFVLGAMRRMSKERSGDDKVART